MGKEAVEPVAERPVVDEIVGKLPVGREGMRQGVAFGRTVGDPARKHGAACFGMELKAIGLIAIAEGLFRKRFAAAECYGSFGVAYQP